MAAGHDDRMDEISRVTAHVLAKTSAPLRDVMASAVGFVIVTVKIMNYNTAWLKYMPQQYSTYLTTENTRRILCLYTYQQRCQIHCMCIFRNDSFLEVN